MATYSEECYSIGEYSYASNFTLYVELSEKWIDQNANTSYVDYNVYCQSSGSGSINANHFKYFYIDGGGELVSETVNVKASSPYAWISIGSGTIGPIEHDENGNKSLYFYAEIEASSYGVAASVEGWFDLTAIPRYAYFSKCELAGTGLNNIDIRYRPDRWISAAQYSLNGQVWTNLTVISGTWNSPDNDVVYRISNLDPNTNYNIKTRIQYADNLWTTSEIINATTKDIAKISSVSDIEHGDNLEVTYSNPSGSSLEIGVYKMDNKTPIAGYRNCSGNLYTFNFTDEELDTLYKSYGNNQELTVKVYIRTAGVASYTNIREITITLKGNQKTANIKINGSWKRAKKWVKINGSWKRCIRWIKVNGSWKRCI